MSNDELVGRKGSLNLSGIPGVGPKRRAAEEQVTNAQRRVDELAKDVAETDKRIAALREKVKAGGEGKATTASTINARSTPPA